jgi:hypothetical protein
MNPSVRAPWLRVLNVWISLGALLIGGCGSGSGNLLPVTGTVGLEGKSGDEKFLDGGSVAFHPDARRGNRSQDIPVATIVNGKYELSTRGKRGAPPGWYKVVVICDNFAGGKVPPKGATAEMPRSVIRREYTQASSTPLEKEVVANPSAGAYDLQLKK